MCGPSWKLLVGGRTQWHGNMSLQKNIDQIAKRWPKCINCLNSQTTCGIFQKTLNCISGILSQHHFNHKNHGTIHPSQLISNTFNLWSLKDLSNLSSFWLAKDAWVGANLDVKLREESPDTKKPKQVGLPIVVLGMLHAGSPMVVLMVVTIVGVSMLNSTSDSLPTSQLPETLSHFGEDFSI